MIKEKKNQKKKKVIHVKPANRSMNFIKFNNMVFFPEFFFNFMIKNKQLQN